MFKEVKFRGKNTDFDEWFYGDLIHYKNGGCAILDKFSKYGCEATEIYKRTIVNKETVCQYIETVNGFEIYHHDIVKAYKYGDKESEPVINEITYRHGTWWFGNWTWIEFLNVFRYVEVIGNRFDNPELLEETQ